MPFIDRTGWIATTDSSAGGAASNVLDNNPATYWEPSSFGQPHWLAFDMGSPQVIKAISILPLAGHGNNNVSSADLYVSADGITWGSPVESNTFTNQTDSPTYWLLSAPYTTRYWKLSMHSFNGVFLQIAEINAGTLVGFARFRPLTTAYSVGTCGDITVNEGLAIDNEPGSPPSIPTTYAVVQQLACGAFAVQSDLTVSAFPTQSITPNEFVMLTVWIALLNSNSAPYVLVRKGGVPYSFQVAGTQSPPAGYGLANLYKLVWVLPDVTDISSLTVDFTHYNSAGGLRSPNELYVFDCYVEVGYSVAPPPPPPIPVILLPVLRIPTGQGQNVNELEGQTSISTLDIETIDPSNQLKFLATKTELVGKYAYFKMGFEGMNLSDFVPLHTIQIADVGRTAEGWMKFGCRDSLAVLDRALWFCGGPQPVALPWLYGQAYTVGQYIQDSNGNIELCVIGGVTSPLQPPVWPGTPAPPWQPNTSYTLGYWATDVYGNLIQVTSVPAGSSPTRPLNTGVSGNGFPDPPWATTLGGTTLDNSGGSSDGPITWTLIAINNALGQTVTDGTVTWQIVAKPDQGAFGGSQAFYVYSIFGDTGQKVPSPPPRTAFTGNQYPCISPNPRYIYGNPIDAFLVALQNELGVGQDPALPPIVTTDPNNPSNALVFAPNPQWVQYLPGDDSTLINPNPWLDLASILAIRDNQCGGRKMEWAIKRPETAKQWIEKEIMHPLGLYMFVGADGRLGLKSMRPPNGPTLIPIDSHSLSGTPDHARLPIVNVVTVRCDVNDEGSYSAARVYDAEMTFAQQKSLSTYLQEFAHSVESNGLRLAYDSYGMAYSFADRTFRRHGFGTPEYILKCHLNQIRVELGDYILLTHPLMLDYLSPTGQLGITNVMCQVMDRQPDYSTGMVTLKVWDCRFMQLSLPYDIVPNGMGLPIYPSQTTAQRKKYMSISYWPGVYSNGHDGNVIF